MDHFYLSIPSDRIWITVLATMLIVVGGLKKKSLSFSGAVSATAVGICTGFAGYRELIILFVFFISSSYFTRIGNKKKVAIDAEHKKGGQRNVIQVLANGFGGTVACFFLIYVNGGREHSIDYVKHPLEARLLAAFIAHYATCAGDTWSSELGVLSMSPPRLITAPWKIVPSGTNGGVSFFGSLAALVAGFTVGVSFSISEYTFLGTVKNFWGIVLFGAICGSFGSVLDSLLGATLQFSGVDEHGKIVTKPAKGVKHVSGLEFLSNDMVNFISALAMSMFGFIACPLFVQ